EEAAVGDGGCRRRRLQARRVEQLVQRTARRRDSEEFAQRPVAPCRQRQREALLRPGEERRRQPGGERRLQDLFPLPRVSQQRRGDLRRQVQHGVVQVHWAHLQRHRHTGPIYLDQDVACQRQLEIEV